VWESALVSVWELALEWVTVLASVWESALVLVSELVMDPGILQHQRDIQFRSDLVRESALAKKKG
jgi:hypothetical protein